MISGPINRNRGILCVLITRKPLCQEPFFFILFVEIFMRLEFCHFLLTSQLPNVHKRFIKLRLKVTFLLVERLMVWHLISIQIELYFLLLLVSFSAVFECGFCNICSVIASVIDNGGRLWFYCFCTQASSSHFFHLLLPVLIQHFFLLK